MLCLATRDVPSAPLRTSRTYLPWAYVFRYATTTVVLSTVATLRKEADQESAANALPKLSELPPMMVSTKHRRYELCRKHTTPLVLSNAATSTRW